MKIFYHFGRYILMLKNLFVRPENFYMYWNETFKYMNTIGIGSVGIVAIISIFVGAVMTIQTAYQLVSPAIPLSVIGAVVSDSVILELAPTITCLVLSGKVGSNLSSELASMRVSEQIDALEVMGVNVTGYLVGPKIIAAIIVIPMLLVISAFLAIYGGLTAGAMSDILTTEQFIQGAQSSFRPYNLVLFLSKSFTFSFLIASVSSYQGFYAKGGALEVGAASTRAVVFSCISILLADYVIADLLL